MKTRYVKRAIRKIIYLVLTIVVLAYITTKIVEKRLQKQEKSVAESPQHDVRPHTQQQQQQQQHKHVRNYRQEMLSGRSDIGKKDWHDYAAMEQDRQRVGFGEHGMPSYILDESIKQLELNISLENGFNALLSDKISVNRSLPDVRNSGCRSKKYLAKLPQTSVVISFYEEYFSVLIRTLHSIVNRTPRELLKEIILVDDFSTRTALKGQLDAYIKESFVGLVRVIRLTERTGLIGARLAGAHLATGDVLVFLDSHIECNYNWLPPLLEPIVLDGRTATCPFVDGIDHSTFAYSGGLQEGFRGGFDWTFAYKQFPLHYEDTTDKTQPLANPVMAGGLFAIGRDFFWELGGYDEGLDIWGGDQYELSFKIWMCGGRLLNVPCSRVAHIYRGAMQAQQNPRDYNYIAKNNMRVAEVWMDDYKKYIYERDPVSYANLNPGDLTKQKAVRDRLQCKSFDWFLKEVASEILHNYPPVTPPDYAMGAIQNVAYPQYCLDTFGGAVNSKVGLYACAENKTQPHNNQYWRLTWHRDIRDHTDNHCLDLPTAEANSSIWLWSCHGQGGNQLWYYDRTNQWIVHGTQSDKCMEAIIVNSEGAAEAQGSPAVVVNVCDDGNTGMKWIFGYVNQSAMDHYFDELL